MRHTILAFTVIVVWSFSCEESFDPASEFVIGDTVTIELDKIRHNVEHEFSLMYVKKTDDSRCPMDATCIWQGDAAVKIKYESRIESREFTLHTNETSSTPTSVVLNGLRIQLVHVMPYPCLSCQNIRKEDETISIVVTKE